MSQQRLILDMGCNFRGIATANMKVLQAAGFELPTRIILGSSEAGAPAIARALDEALGEGGWLKAIGLDRYTARSRNKPEMLQGVLFSYLEAL